ncbi:heme ABC exporter ATP-binding protein CcmA [Devosia sp. 63-57]|uniref:heme ABC exporter ATP-binding protein CcmA n=1 Tax=Devosia sp. 63-57 TaxID=1895751 RepID=UPI0008691990|nr:heme ABC exporter ATP-binding protein CcmA [Devosia sp. 63-57]ODT49516.1 MAG: heme ABC exporter, ATP-binding protein CcmA [Pelagibacterium sp. SCN 63-126]ODU83906.1 MAG: heme ABC exporter, ATP-binding protein CcmA [Pelagibacterium sp. SCN 63-17]OJX41818.1 MAG: heme ABC exporter, ATP-binding protein CcmA [Devosia sp. 63-57]
MTQRQVFPQLRLNVHGLSCGRGDAVLLEGLDLALDSGHALLLRGPNGSGKSTLLLTLAGLLRPLEGTITLEAHDEENGPPLHYCGHRNAVRARLGVLETLNFWRALNGAGTMEPEAALERVGLGRAALLDAAYLSAGQQRRLALARLLVSPRPLWLLDEPTAALDSEGHALVAALVIEHLASGGLAIIATHDPLDIAACETLTLGGPA